MSNAKPTSAASHTPTPWKVNKRSAYDLFGGKRVHNFQIETGGEPVALLGRNQEKNAELIVRAVNSHEELLNALKRAVEFFDVNGGDSDYSWLPMMKRAIDRAEDSQTRGGK